MQPSNQTNTLAEPARHSGVRTRDVLLALLIPPIGLVLAIVVLGRAIKGKKKDRLKTASAILVATLVGAVGYWYVLAINHNSASTPVKKILYGQSYDTKYSQLDDVSLSGSAPGSGISLKKPVEFKKTSQINKPDSVTISFTQLNGAGQGVGFLAVSSVTSKQAGDQDYRNSVNALLKQAGGNEYQKFASVIYSFVQSSTSPKFTVTLGRPSLFTGDNIKGNAWQFAVNARSKPHDPDQLTPLEGKFYLIMGDKSFYYIGLYSLNYNWQPNQSIWRQIESSIKIDQ